jgi:PmbA protein
MHSYSEGHQPHPALTFATDRLEQMNPDQFEIYYERRASTRIDSKNQEVDTLTRSEDIGLSIRVIKDQRLGFSFTTSLEKKAVHDAIETAFEVARLMPQDPHLGFYSFGKSVYPNVDHFDSVGLNVPLSEKIKMAKKLEELCRSSDARIKAVRQASISETVFETHLVDSQGETIKHQSTGYTASITCKAEEGDDSQMGGEFGFSNYLDSVPIDLVAKLSAQWAVELLGAKKAPTLKCPAILRNSVVADLLEFLSSSFSAEQIDKGKSMLAGKNGQLIFSDQITIIDDGLLPGGAGTTPFDAEGIPSKKLILVDGGFFTSALYDTYYARKHNVDPTSSSVRGIKSPPSIGFSNLYLKPGQKSFESLCDGIPKGILITDLMGIHTANSVTGDFSLGASGILIENGKLTQPVRGFAVAGNVLELFRRMTDFSNDLRFFGRIGAPSVRLSELSIGGS